MSGLSMDNTQTNVDRQHYMNMVNNAIIARNNMKSGEPDNTVMRFGSLYSMREQMEGQQGFGMSLYPHDRSGGSFFSDVLNGFMRDYNKSQGKGKSNDGIHIDINSHKNDDEEPKGGEMKVESESDSEIEKKSRGGMVLSSEAQKYHKNRSAGRKKTNKKTGGRAPTGADFSGADIVNSEPIKNSGPEVGGKAKLGDKVPNTNAGQGVQSWTEYPNKNISNEDIKEATATTRDIQNDFPVANMPSVDVIHDGIMRIASGKRNYSQKAILGGIKRKTGGWAFLAPLAAQVAVPFVQGAISKIGDWLGFGKQCGGGKELKLKIQKDLDDLKKATKKGGAAVASPDIDEGKRSPITAGINEATQIDGYQDPRTTGLASQAGVGATLGGKKKRNRKPMTTEQKQAFAKRMAEAKAKKRIQT